MWKLYNKLLTRQPILVQSITTAFLFATGDVVAQQYVERKGIKNHDVVRTMRMTAFGGCFAGPVLGNWYRFLELNVKGSTPIQALVKKVAMDQFLCAPVFIGIFFSAQGLLEGKSVNEIKEKLQQGYTTAVLANYKLWPAVQLVNFYVVPLYYRLAVTNLVSIGWNAYLSNVNQRSSSSSISQSATVIEKDNITSPL
ncbi:hypothetical protein LRAMOSA07018 [Lichtheimia ramosa]|uniref:Protein SYM1 n=1 Tax=Lichtheimia ramosa TaxID=688394 RepID=A0A077WD20_9FUNG|nr:hypothetical protein LRAMOSA07018 [Lichtheimia ramosa]